MNRPLLPGADTPVANAFEHWLSHLVDAPLWSDNAQTMRKRVALADVATAIRAAQTAAQLLAADDEREPPEWLSNSFRYRDAAQATVITFNTDVLINMA